MAFATAALLPAVAHAQLVDAQPADGTAPVASDITITGQRQQYLGDTPTRDVPQNIQMLDKAILAKTGITRMADALDMVSGVARQNSFGGLWDSYAIRGFAGEINVPSGFLVNGFNYGRGFGGPRDLSGVERIEVLKGPTSALFGRGEPGGTVNIVTRKPEFTAGGSAMVQGGSFNTYRLEADYTTPVTDSLAIRLNGAFEDGDSFRDTVEVSKHVISPSVLWKISDATSVSYQFTYVHQEIPLDRGVIALGGKLGLIPISRFLGEPADGPTRTNDYGHQIEVQHDFSSNWSALLGLGYRSTSLKGYSEWPELVAGRQPIFTDGQTLSRQRRRYDFATDDLVVRGEISGQFDSFGLTHHVMIGADYDEFIYQNRLYRSRPPLLSTNPTFDQLNAIDIYNPVYRDAAVLPATTSVIYNQRERAESWGVYLQDRIDVTDRIKIRVGGRYDHYAQTIRANATGLVRGQKHEAFSPQVGIVYEPLRTVSLYASYGEGFRANTGNDFAGNPFDPERTKSWEVGAKYASANGRITASLAAFLMDKNNILTADPVNQGSVLAIGTARSKGVELDLSAQLPFDLRVLGSFAYIDAYATSSVGDPDFGKLVSAGDPLINIPKISGNLLMFKDFQIGDRKGSIGAGVNHVAKRLGETGTTFNLPAYTLVRLLASVDVSDRLQLSGEINNLFDKTYYVNSYAALWVYPGTPRNFAVRARYRF